MKMIFRGDDLGISEGVNYGLLKSIQDGALSCVGICLIWKVPDMVIN